MTTEQRSKLNAYADSRVALIREIYAHLRKHTHSIDQLDRIVSILLEKKK